MSDRVLKVLAGLSMLALLAVTGAAIVTGGPAVASSLAPKVERAIDGGGYEDVTSTVRGREVFLANGTRDELKAAGALAEQVPGVRSAAVSSRRDAVEEVDTSRPYLRIRRDGERLRIIGAVRDASTAATLKVAAARAFDLPVRGDLVIDDQLPTALWTTQLPAALIPLASVDHLELFVDGSILSIDGDPEPLTDPARLLASVRAAVPSLQIASPIGVDS